MKVVAIEVAEAIENEIANFLKDWGGGYVMRFTRFIDLGGKQAELYLYPAEAGAPPWSTINVKSVFKGDDGDCMVYTVNLPSSGKKLEDVLVSPEIWKIPALTDKILKFIKTDLLLKINEGGGALEAGGLALEPTAPSLPEESASTDDDEDELDDLDTEGILAGDGSEESSGFDPMDIIAAAQTDSEQNDQDGAFDPESVIQDANEQSDDADAFDPESVIQDANEQDSDSDSGFNPEDVIKD